MTLLRQQGSDLWPPVVPSAVLIESVTGRAGPDATTNRFLRTCDIDDHLPERLARRAVSLRCQAGRGTAVDALVVAVAEPGGAVLTGDAQDVDALAERATDVEFEHV